MDKTPLADHQKEQLIALALENKPDERDLEPKDIIFVGDRQSDEEAAESYGCQFIWAENLLHPKPLFIGYNRVVR